MYPIKSFPKKDYLHIMFHQPISSLGWDGDINFVIRGYGTQNNFSLPYSNLNGSHKW